MEESMIEIPAETLAEFQARIDRLSPDPAHADDALVIQTIQEAWAALQEGNAAIGALIVDPEGRVVQSGHNRMFHPKFRSDYHAEMAVLTDWEERVEPEQTLKGYALYTSLEPCEMCMIRLINSGVSRVYYAAKDDKGKTDRRDEWAPHWQRLAANQVFAPADCTPELRELAWQLFVTAAPGITEKMMARR
jgi:tRNA(adenine34) deaminase